MKLNLTWRSNGLCSVLGFRGPGYDGHGEYYPVQWSYAGQGNKGKGHTRKLLQQPHSSAHGAQTEVLYGRVRKI